MCWSTEATKAWCHLEMSLKRNFLLCIVCKAKKNSCCCSVKFNLWNIISSIYMLLLWSKNLMREVKMWNWFIWILETFFSHRQFLNSISLNWLYSSHINFIVNYLWPTWYGNGMVLYKVHSIPTSSTTVTRQLGVLWDFSRSNILYWYGAQPYQCHFVRYGEYMGFCQIRRYSNSQGSQIIWYWYGAEPYEPHTIKCRKHMEFWQIRSNSI